MRAHRIAMHENYFAKPQDAPSFIKEKKISPEFLSDLQRRTAPQWFVPFSQKAREFGLLKEYKRRQEHDLIFSEETSKRWSKGEQRSSLLSDRMLRRMKERSKPELQSGGFDPKAFLDQHTDPIIVGFVEDVLLFAIQLYRSRNAIDRLTAATVFIKARTGTNISSTVASIISLAIEDLTSPTLQVDDDLLDRITDLRSLVANWEAIQNSAIAQQLGRVYKYIMALGIMSMVGVKVDERAAYEAKKELRSPLMGANFMVTVIDTVALLVQRGLLFLKTGSWETFVHGPKTFGSWFDACQKVKREFQFRGDLESQGTSYPQFLADLRKCIEEGGNILKYGDKAVGAELIAVKRLLNEMLMLRAEISTYTEAQKSRRPPSGWLVFGKTCVGKSTFTSMLFQFAGKVLMLPTADEYRYTRNSCDDFWSGWDSMKWFLLLDDIAFANPDGKIVDNSLKEVIQIMNDVPLVPNQASLEDKGRNPMRARMCVATTNVRHLNAHAHFACPIAVQRRFPFVLSVMPKKEFARDDDEEMIDPSKLPPITDEWPDFWIISVERVSAVNSHTAKYDVIEVFSDINKFLVWFANAIKDFDAIQNRAGAGVKAMADFEVCRQCYMLESKCSCARAQSPALQSRDYVLPSNVQLGQPFRRQVKEGNRTWRYLFEPFHQADSNYLMTTQVLDAHGDVERQYVCYVNVSNEVEAPVLQNSDIDMAEVIAHVVRESASRKLTTTKHIVTWCIDKYLAIYTRSRLVRSFTHGVMSWQLPRVLLLHGFRLYTRDSREYFAWLGDVVGAAYVSKKWRYILGGLAVVSAGMVTYGLYQSHVKSKPDIQGLRQSVPDSHFPVEERENVWKRDDYATSSFDKTSLNVSFASLPYDALMQVVERNTARIKISDGVRAREGNAFSPCGHLWMTNNHSIMEQGELTVTLSVVPHVQGASPNVTFTLRQQDILRFPERDLAFFEVFSWETKRDLRLLIRKPSLFGAYTAHYVTRTKGIDTQIRKISCAAPSVVHVPTLDREMQTWTGYCDTPTVVGDCGSPLVSHQPVAAILGIHLMGNARGEVWAVSVDSDIVDSAIKHFATPIVQCSVPEISGETRQKLLVPLKQKSPLRWLEEGTVTCYGSYAGFTATSRSKVRPTLLADKILAERKWNVEFGTPVLNDWRPWRLALLDSTQKKFGALSPSVMKDLARAFADDILDRLPKSALKGLEPLTTKAAINGIPGVRFIDKMNFKSSMGEPYNTAKKHFISGVEGDMKFNEEIMKRVARIEECYAKGQRASPVFGGQIKDEPRSFAKIAAGKLRVFTTAPGDWSMVVRKYLLPVVKVIQENPFIFEASPGCTVQSLEWQAYYVYLTQHGVDRLVAGDYGKFDKKMEALIILLAFGVLARLYEAAGWTEDELVTIWCIAEDTAYAFVNFNGDLIAFMGSNPSGHPLTVIINCIVNSLYMRFAFVTLHPGEGSVYTKAREFKDMVNLLTYGDDNAMGVSPAANWFNHTAIQEAMTNIGVEYTMADKESHSRPFIHIREVSYLKRTWRWDEDVGAIVCPLEVASIHKMLTVCNPSDTESPELHMASVMTSAINEWFWYGRETFERERTWIVELAKKNGLERELAYKGAPTWQELYDRFWKASQEVSGAALGCELEHPRSLLPN